MASNSNPQRKTDCPKSFTGEHVPNWKTVSVTADENSAEFYFDVLCRYCGQSGCIGKASTFAPDIAW